MASGNDSRDETQALLVSGGGQEMSYITPSSNATGAAVYFRVADDHSPIGSYGYGIIKKMIFEGIGEDPFKGRITS